MGVLMRLNRPFIYGDAFVDHGLIKFGAKERCALVLGTQNTTNQYKVLTGKNTVSGGNATIHFDDTFATTDDLMVTAVPIATAGRTTAVVSTVATSNFRVRTFVGATATAMDIYWIAVGRA